MPAENAQLANALKQAKTKPMFFACVAKGADGKLLVGKKTISAGEIAEAKKECGGGTVFKGRCLGEEGTLVFEVAKEPPGTLAGLIKKMIKNEASLTLQVVVRANTAVESETSDSETEQPEEIPPIPPPAPTAPSTPPRDGAAVTKRLNTLAGAMKAALAGPDHARVQTLFASVSGLVKNKNFVQAGIVLDELEPLVAKTSATPEDDDAAEETAQKKLLTDLVHAWQTAKESVDSQIGQLQNALKASGDPDYQAIAAFGLNGVAGNHMVPLLAAIRDAVSAKGTARQDAAVKGLGIANAFFKHVSSSPEIMACDENPLGIKLTIRATLRKALQQVSQDFTRLAK